MQRRHTREELAELKLRRLLLHNQTLKTQLDLPRLPVSEASQKLIDYCQTTPDPLLPSLWGPVKEDPFTPLKSKWACCLVM
ncbi:heterotrimeric G-protein gamma subunit (G-gamma, Gpg) [Halteromyces radiatus]|uniref:heterotrimeric G-protein gamma subunit (G-gamma, Gpg) n=1 Tax=Halteromyces radiatus TaxID=101107 RepID=UPI00221EAC41|nr:heterotrimeric G-protein gamma subunit (G-gamma, Gpg) [Halteromyces radiatus]KAI8086291.1 heterotrimeric G-protein gamma subunit (G-gamma, Gpg) [Halteromyces radiatus]